MTTSQHRPVTQQKKKTERKAFVQQTRPFEKVFLFPTHETDYRNFYRWISTFYLQKNNSCAYAQKSQQIHLQAPLKLFKIRLQPTALV